MCGYSKRMPPHETPVRNLLLANFRRVLTLGAGVALMIGVIGGVFLWALRGGQFDDLEAPAHRILIDDDL